MGRFGRALTLAGIIALSSSGIIRAEEATEANKLLREFPVEIPGAAKIEKYETPGADYTLVHIRDNGAQKNLYDIIGFLSGNNGLKVIYAEGRSTNKEYNTNNWDSLFPKTSAVRTLADEGKITIGPAEIEPKKLLVERLTKEGVSQRKIDFIITDQMEFDVLKILVTPDYAVERSPIKYVVYGASHSWNKVGNTSEIKSSFNNLEVWNTQKPSDKFSLIVITPNP